LANFETRNNDLYINGHKVIRGWESFNGWYWFATEKSGEQLSDFEDGKPTKDTIWYGYVQGLDEEWGYFSQAEIERLRPKTWEIRKHDLPYSGRRNR